MVSASLRRKAQPVSVVRSGLHRPGERWRLRLEKPDHLGPPLDFIVEALDPIESGAAKTCVAEHVAFGRTRQG